MQNEMFYALDLELAAPFLFRSRLHRRQPRDLSKFFTTTRESAINTTLKAFILFLDIAMHETDLVEI